jgi:hypothetical protein
MVKPSGKGCVYVDCSIFRERIGLTVLPSGKKYAVGSTLRKGEVLTVPSSGKE